MLENNRTWLKISLAIAIIAITITIFVFISSDLRTNSSDSDNSFIIKVDSTGLGYVTDNDEYLIPAEYEKYDYNYDLEWNQVNGNNSGEATNLTGDHKIEFGEKGIYEIQISGKYPQMKYKIGEHYNEINFRKGIVSVEQWGDIEWRSMNGMFATSSIYYNATDNPDLSNVENMRGMFGGKTVFNGDISGWDTSNVQNMQAMFAGEESFNQDIGGWDTSSVENMRGMFARTDSFNQDISSWNVSNVNDMYHMFLDADSFNRNLSSWNPNITNCNVNNPLASSNCKNFNTFTPDGFDNSKMPKGIYVGSNDY